MQAYFVHASRGLFAVVYYPGLAIGTAVAGSFTAVGAPQLAYADGSVFEYDGDADDWSLAARFEVEVATGNMMAAVDVDGDGLDDIVSEWNGLVACFSATHGSAPVWEEELSEGMVRGLSASRRLPKWHMSFLPTCTVVQLLPSASMPGASVNLAHVVAVVATTTAISPSRCRTHAEDPEVINPNLSCTPSDSIAQGALAIGDVNGDGMPEVVYGDGPSGRELHALDSSTGEVILLIGSSPVEGGVSAITVGDFDGDGEAEVGWGAGDPDGGPNFWLFVDTK